MCLPGILNPGYFKFSIGHPSFYITYMKAVLFVFLCFIVLSCGPSQKAQQQTAGTSTGTILIKNSSDTTVRLPRGTSQAVWAGSTLYVSGSLDPDLKQHTTTEQQTAGVLNYLKNFLAREGLTFGDVVMVRVYLGADPAKEGKMDFLGMQNAYKQFFGTPEQPNKPARTTVQVVLPAADSGALVEIDLIAVRSK